MSRTFTVEQKYPHSRVWSEVESSASAARMEDLIDDLRTRRPDVMFRLIEVETRRTVIDE